METVSYLTINDETKQIADISSRNDIENIAAVVATQGNNIKDLQFETGPNGSIVSSLDRVETTTQTAIINAAAATAAAELADQKAVSAGEAADRAWNYADSASDAATVAQNKADAATASAEIANTQAASATNAANVAWSQADSAVTAADIAITKANEATDAAAIANSKADAATIAAESAQRDARQANSYANGALAGLSTLESVIDTVNWFAEHKSISTDTQVEQDKDYYIYDESTGVMSKVEPTGSENPSEEGWYEIDETIQNYVASHVAQTDDGLYVLSTSEGWRVLISTGANNYVPGIFIVDPYGVTRQALTGDGIKFNENTPFSIGGENAYIVFDGNGHITLGGAGVNILSSVTIGGSQKTLSQVLNDLDAALISIEYGSGTSRTSHSDITNWSSNTPDWEPGKYIWMRTSNGTTYTYTCIQGAQGERGEVGPQGERGEQGGEGVGILSIETSYAVSDSEDVIPGDEEWKTSLNQWSGYYELEEGETGLTGETGWTGEADEIDESDLLNLPKGSWLWIRTETTYSDFTSNTTYQKSYIGTDGEDGKSIFIQSASKEDGVTTVVLVDSEGNTETLTIRDGEDGTSGTPGAAGYVHIAWATSQDGSQGFSTSESTNKTYMGVYTDNTETDSENPIDYSWSLIKGEKGDQGDAAYTYGLLCDPSSIVKTSAAATPPMITFISKRAQGTENPVSYAGRFIIATSVDGVNWTDQYTSQSDETTKIYAPSAGTRFVRAQLYAAGGTSTMIDTQTVPIISDGEPGRQGEDGKILNIHSGIYTESQLPSIGSVEAADAYLVDDGDGQYDLYYKGTNATTWTIVENWQGVAGPQGETGDTGPQGVAGKGISSVTEQYARNNSSSTAPTSGWDTSVLVPTSSEKYVWNREIMNYTDGTSSAPTLPHLVAIFGERGSDGRGIASVTEYYAVNNDYSTVPADSDFSTTVVTPTITNRYLWNYEIITYTTGNPAITDKRVIGVYGETGATGATGATGKTGATGAPGADAYTINLTNEAHTFPAGTNAALASETTCHIIAYKGTTQVPVSIGTITGQVTGLTTSISNNGTTSAFFTVTAATTLTTRNGTLNIPIVVDGKSFEKKFTWSLSLEGKKGDKGDKGDSGQTGATGPEAVVTITPTSINWAAGIATLAATLRVNGVITLPTGYNWTKNTDSDSLGTAATLEISDLNATYNCTVTW